LVFIVIWYFSLPKPLFDTPLSTVVWSKNDKLLGARVAKDGQWRFPPSTEIPKKFETCIIYFEDEYFEYHPGFNPVSIFKALGHNLTEDGKRGGSTLTQQVVRLSRQQPRTYSEKLIELFLAIRLEVEFSKKEILNFYASYAPFGGNVVGLETASWRYFNLPAKDLNWSQSAALAVLPNAPSLVFPGRNEDIYKQKRDRLLKKLFDNKIIDSTTYKLSLLEDLPGKVLALPNITPQLTEWLRQTDRNAQIKTTINFERQLQINGIVERHLNIWSNNQVYNAAVLVADVKTGNVISYTANTLNPDRPFYHVDMIRSERSTGSLLKPILYASLIDDGELLPQQLVKDTPARFNNYAPQNFSKSFLGAVPADISLQKSLNVPAVRLLKVYGIERFINKLNQLGLESIDKSADHYGLPLILGGAESSLWQLTQMYTLLAQGLRFSETSQAENLSQNLNIIADKEVTHSNRSIPKVLSPASIYNMFEAMSGLDRPGLDAGWKAYASSQKIAWKTGTSYGFKDAWSIGLTKDYVVGVWVGNADGNGRPNLVGVNAAAPLMFSVFENLPKSGRWFEKPYSDMKTVEVCAKSGFLRSLNCPQTEKIDIPKVQLKLKPCSYHRLVNLTGDEQYQVNLSCNINEERKTSSWFVLPPIMEYYYKKQHSNYKTLPDYHPNCRSLTTTPIELIYPKPNQDIILPKTFEGTVSQVVFKAVYDENKTLYWHIDDKYVGSTQYFHEMQLQPKSGEHILTLVGEEGQQIQRSFKLNYTD
jgi:penicillin-binding protein 1C